MKKLYEARSPGLRAILDAVQPQPIDGWEEQDKAMAALQVILEALAAIKNESWKAVTMAAYRRPADLYAGPEFNTRAARWKERARRDEGVEIHERRELEHRLEVYRGFFILAGAELAQAVAERFDELNHQPHAWDAYRGIEPAPPPTHFPVDFERVDVLFRLRGNVGVQQITYRWLKAREMVDGIEAVGWYYNEPDADLEILPLANCALEGEPEELARGGRVGKLRFNHLLEVGDDYFYAYAINYNSTKPCRPVVSHEVRGNITKLLIMRVQFDPSFRPARCWRFESVGETDGQRPPVDGSPRYLEVPSNGYVDYHFQNATFGRKYGIMWRWES